MRTAASIVLPENTVRQITAGTLKALLNKSQLYPNKELWNVTRIQGATTWQGELK